MDFDLTDEQVMLRDTVRDLLARTYDAENRLKVLDTELGWSREVWSQLAELGVLGLSFSEDDGGVGAGPVETMVVMEEVGRALAPEPLLDAVLLPGGLIATLGSAEQRQRILPEVTGGTRLLAFAHEEAGARWPDLEVSATATADGDGYRLTGVKSRVPHGDCADELVVTARGDDGALRVFLVAAEAEGVTRTPYRTFDERRGARIEFASAPAELLGDAAADAEAAVTEAVATAQASLCAESVGAMGEAMRLTTEYLKTRKQFGVTLSKFQTLTQRAADMYVSLELARSMSYYATASLAEGAVDATALSRARLQVGRGARHIGQEAVQMHGGIGITTEYPVSHYVARLTAVDQTLGGRREHLGALSARVGEYGLAEL
ncbi:acyl-CoA dehydrogenase [Nocardia nova SH22a]|uniref:Acyl-CoA dehydrogenase n=1 Tax=Nocardia nova SH22a TaxID=1415166 RepID=W5TQA2_9NOCA|nr:acyl-CoA dehydrogenase family protein [Nocardia nova]AHH21133.1 acyl-CoA dehydrogenase [Nocardia nova SH22a]